MTGLLKQAAKLSNYTQASKRSRSKYDAESCRAGPTSFRWMGLHKHVTVCMKRSLTMVKGSLKFPFGQERVRPQGRVLAFHRLRARDGIWCLAGRGGPGWGPGRCPPRGPSLPPPPFPRSPFGRENAGAWVCAHHARLGVETGLCAWQDESCQGSTRAGLSISCATRTRPTRVHAHAPAHTHGCTCRGSGALSAS